MPRTATSSRAGRSWRREAEHQEESTESNEGEEKEAYLVSGVHFLGYDRHHGASDEAKKDQVCVCVHHLTSGTDGFVRQ